MGSDSKIFVAGHKGLVGSAIVRHLEAEGFTNIITADRKQCDLTVLNDVKKLFQLMKSISDLQRLRVYLATQPKQKKNWGGHPQDHLKN